MSLTCRILLVVACCGLSTVADAAKKKNCIKNEKSCKDCKYCYCAFQGDLRKRTDKDNPVYIENDPLGHYCYCQQRDVDKARADEAVE